MNKHLQSSDLPERFMEMTINKVNTCLSGLYTIQKILIERNIITEAELIQRLKDDKARPEHLANMKILQEMVKDYNKEKL